MIYRLHITCPAGHTDWRDYKHFSSASRAWRKNWSDKVGWYATHIELLAREPTMSNYDASDFLDPDRFCTGYDVDQKHARKRYLDACVKCDDYSEIFISVNDTVSANLKVGKGHMTGYEKLGYHAYSCEYLRAILDSGCPITVYRIGSDGGVEQTRIK